MKRTARTRQLAISCFSTTKPFAFKGEQRYNKLVWQRVK